MEKSAYNYTEEEKLLLKRNTRQSVNIIMLGYIVCYAVLLIAGVILSVASRAMNTAVGVAFAGVVILVMYAVMLMRATFTMLGVNSFRRENRFSDSGLLQRPERHTCPIPSGGSRFYI